jgi:hypothetical protein
MHTLIITIVITDRPPVSSQTFYTSYDIINNYRSSKLMTTIGRAKRSLEKHYYSIVHDSTLQERLACVLPKPGSFATEVAEIELDGKVISLETFKQLYPEYFI